MTGYRKGEPPANKGRRRTPEPFTQEEVLAIVRPTSRRGHGGFRDRALIIVLWRTGLRISEALNLRPRDLDLEHGFLRVRHGKGDKFRIVGIEPAAVAELESWLERRAAIPNMRKGGFVFCTISQPEPGGRMGATIIGILGALAVPALGVVATALVTGASTLLCIWSLAGTASLIDATVFHAARRAELMRGADEAEGIRAKRLSERLRR